METDGIHLDASQDKENPIDENTLSDNSRSQKDSLAEERQTKKTRRSSSTQVERIERQLRNFNSILSLMPTNKIRGMVNDLTDDLLKSLGPKLKLLNLDPLKLTERSVDFEKQICCKTYPGVAELKNGVCKGLSTARRHGEVGLDMNEGKAEIMFSIRIGPVSITYDSDVTLRNHVYHPTFTATTEYIDIIVNLVFNVKDATIEMQKMKIEEIGAITVKITNMLIFYRFLVKPVVAHLIESEKKFLINKVNLDFKDTIKALAQNPLNVKRWLPTSLFG